MSELDFGAFMEDLEFKSACAALRDRAKKLAAEEAEFRRSVCV